MTPDIDLNPHFKHALDLLENTSHNVFITGRAGTGKSTLLSYFRQHTTKKIAVLAPTGVAALNVNGQTIHSFFKFKPSVTVQSIRKKKEQKADEKKNIYKKLDVIVIDEISMVRADLLDCVDKFLRLNGRTYQQPFGGLQMIFIGDLYQLPPVVTSHEKEIFHSQYPTPYFFSAHFFEYFAMEWVELEKIYRQKDISFIHLLNSIRNRTTSDTDIARLNQRVKPESGDDDGIYLTPKHDYVRAINDEKLSLLRGKMYTFEARVEGTFGPESYPTKERLDLKCEAQVMMVNNDRQGRWVNGTMGKVSCIERDEEGFMAIHVTLEGGQTVEVSPYTWEIHRLFLKEEVIRASVIGSFTQYPLVLAWALTIHKSQGKTSSKVTLDMGSGAFIPGQVYVALSRCTSLEGLTLKKPLEKKHIWLDYEVVKFMTHLQYQKSEDAFPLAQKVALIEELLKDKQPLEMVYLKANNEKSQRTVTPLTIGEMAYKDKSFLGMTGFCHTSQEDRVFRVDRILEIKTGVSGR